MEQILANLPAQISLRHGQNFVGTLRISVTVSGLFGRRLAEKTKFFLGHWLGRMGWRAERLHPQIISESVWKKRILGRAHLAFGTN